MPGMTYHSDSMESAAEEMQADLMDRLGIADLLRPATADEETR